MKFFRMRQSRKNKWCIPFWVKDSDVIRFYFEKSQKHDEIWKLGLHDQITKVRDLDFLQNKENKGTLANTLQIPIVNASRVKGGGEELREGKRDPYDIHVTYPYQAHVTPCDPHVTHVTSMWLCHMSPMLDPCDRHVTCHMPPTT